MNKWVEVMALVKSNDQALIDFLYGDIFTRFGVPKDIVKDREVKFVSRKMEALF